MGRAGDNAGGGKVEIGLGCGEGKGRRRIRASCSECPRGLGCPTEGHSLEWWKMEGVDVRACDTLPEQWSGSSGRGAGAVVTAGRLRRRLQANRESQLGIDACAVKHTI